LIVVGHDVPQRLEAEVILEEAVEIAGIAVTD
jgi:hypothetical protein